MGSILEELKELDIGKGYFGLVLLCVKSEVFSLGFGNELRRSIPEEQYSRGLEYLNRKGVIVDDKVDSEKLDFLKDKYNLEIFSGLEED